MNPLTVSFSLIFLAKATFLAGSPGAPLKDPLKPTAWPGLSTIVLPPVTTGGVTPEHMESEGIQPLLQAALGSDIFLPIVV